MTSFTLEIRIVLVAEHRNQRPSGFVGTHLGLNHELGVVSML